MTWYRTSTQQPAFNNNCNKFPTSNTLDRSHATSRKNCTPYLVQKCATCLWTLPTWSFGKVSFRFSEVTFNFHRCWVSCGPLSFQGCVPTDHSAHSQTGKIGCSPSYNPHCLDRNGPASWNWVGTPLPVYQHIPNGNAFFAASLIQLSGKHIAQQE